MRCLLGIMVQCCRNKRIPRKPRDAEWEELWLYRSQDPLYVTFTSYHMPHIGMNLQDQMRTELDKVKIPVFLALAEKEWLVSNETA